VGDGRGVNYATFHKELHDRLRAMFKPAKT
jgi:hypothetical protein